MRTVRILPIKPSLKASNKKYKNVLSIFDLTGRFVLSFVAFAPNLLLFSGLNQLFAEVGVSQTDYFFGALPGQVSRRVWLCRIP